MATRTVTHFFAFLGGMVIPAAGSGTGFPWVKTITGAAPPTCAVSGKRLRLALTSAAQAQNVCLSFDNVLSFDIDDIVRATFWLAVSTAIGATAKWRVGLASARNDDPDAIVASLFIGASADANLDIECDDGTNETAATSIGMTIGTTLKKVVFDFSDGIATAAPPSLSAGGKAKIICKVENGNGQLLQVAKSTTLDMSAYSAGLQPYAQIQKTSSTDVGTLEIEAIEIEERVAA